MGIPVDVLLNGIPIIERKWWRWKRERVVGWRFPPITALELQQWSAFERVEGPILLHDRVETSMGIAAMMAAAPYSPKGRELALRDFMPHWDLEEDTSGQSAEDIMNTLKSMAAKNDAEGEVTFYDDGSGDVHS